MSRTIRNIEFANINSRRLAHYNYRRNELAALEEILDEGFIPSNRLASSQSRIADNWDDVDVAAYTEVFNND